MGDGPTLYEALAAVNATADVQPGGPWNISQVYGVASPVPVNPSAWGWGQYDRVMASCPAAFNGLTIWNGTLPLFHGTFDSGTAPFWQFVYYSNTTQQILVGTDVRGVVHIFPPIAWSSECAASSGLSYMPWLWKAFWGEAGYPADSPTIASNDWNFMAQRYVQWLGTPVAEMYLFGAAPFGSGQPPADQINFFTCGTVGGVGATRGLALYGPDGVTSLGTGNTFNYTLGCTPTANNWTAISIQLRFSNETALTANGTTVARQEFSLFYPTGPPAGPAYNARGITSWMIGLNLTASNGQPLPIAPSLCATWVSSLSDCLASASGWYAVLLSPGGAWEGSYGAASNGPDWTYPVLPIVNNETLALVAPSTWNLSGDSLSVTSTTSELPLNGTTALP